MAPAESEVIVVDPVMTAEELAGLTEAWARFPCFTPSGAGSYARRRRRRAERRRERRADRAPMAPLPTAPRPPASLRFAPDLESRADARFNYLARGGLRGDLDDPLLDVRSSYFRETFIEGSEHFAAGMEVLFHNPALADAARRLYGREVVVPWNLYANVMLPGQELGLHTDIPEFRGVRRSQVPSWLLCAMHHSGLFEPWRITIATAVTYLVSGGSGGALVCFRQGAGGPPHRIPARANTAAVFDSDTVFHGVERVDGDAAPLAGLHRDAQLVPDGHGRWSLRCDTAEGFGAVASYRTDEVRCSISWKAYCFADEAERAATEHPDPATALRPQGCIDTLTGELCARGRLRSRRHGLSEEELARVIIDEFIPFPTLEAGAT